MFNALLAGVRSRLAGLFAPPTTTDRLALAFAEPPGVTQFVLDRLGGDAERAEQALLYAAGANLRPAAALEELFSVPNFDGLKCWADTVDGRQAILAWRAAQALPRPFRLRAALAGARSLRKAMWGTAG